MVGLRPQARTFRRHRSTDPSSRFRRKPLFEALEPRLLLSADLGSAAVVEALASQANQQAQSDGLTPQTLITTSIPLLITPADGGAGTLRAGNADNIWRITGPDQVTLNGVAYDNVGTLIGGEHNEDTFIVEPNGSLSGYLDGNLGGFDTLVIEGGSYTNTEYTASGPDSGTVTLDIPCAARGIEQQVEETNDDRLTESLAPHCASNWNRLRAWGTGHLWRGTQT